MNDLNTKKQALVDEYNNGVHELNHLIEQETNLKSRLSYLMGQVDFINSLEAGNSEAKEDAQDTSNLPITDLAPATEVTPVETAPAAPVNATVSEPAV